MEEETGMATDNFHIQRELESRAHRGKAEP